MPDAPATTRFHLIRHGRVDEAWHGRIYGDLDVPLAPEGREEARRIAAVLAGTTFDAVVSSGLARAEFGAAALREGRGLPRSDEPRLREISRGEWAGLTFEELDERQPGAFAAWLADPSQRPPGGESLDDVAARVVPPIEELARARAGAQLGVVCHSWVARVLACRALGLPPTSATRMDLPTAGNVVVDWPSGAVPGLRPTLVGFAVDIPPARGVRWFRGPNRS
ncbi:MAG: histidine phosphatase family protein [Planctomycetota bacterium]